MPKENTREFDASIKLTLELVPEIDAETKQSLAEKHSPIMHFHKNEHFHPVEMRAMLDQSSLKNAAGATLKSAPPAAAPSQGTASSTSAGFVIRQPRRVFLIFVWRNRGLSGALKIL